MLKATLAGVLLVGTAQACSPFADNSYSCTDAGRDATAGLAKHLVFATQKAAPEVVGDCEDAGLGVALKLDGTLDSVQRALPTGLACTVTRNNDRSRRLRCTDAKTGFRLRLVLQSPAREQKDGFAVSGWAEVLKSR